MVLILYIKGRPTHQITVDYINCCTLLYLDTSTVISYSMSIIFVTISLLPPLDS
jgi:hypothetical protein